MAQKLDLYKLHKAEYVTPKSPQLVKVKPAKYLVIAGVGAPEGEEFQTKIGALYAMAYTLKFQKKFAGKDYKVCGLEGLWQFASVGDFMHQPRESWQWKLIILTPNFVTPKNVDAAIKQLIEKGKPPQVRDVHLEKIGEGLCVQMLHVGPYATETETIARMQEFAAEQGLQFHGAHHEIYISDPRRVKPEKLRTILRMPVRKGSN